MTSRGRILTGVTAALPAFAAFLALTGRWPQAAVPESLTKLMHPGMPPEEVIRRLPEGVIARCYPGPAPYIEVSRTGLFEHFFPSSDVVFEFDDGKLFHAYAVAPGIDETVRAVPLG